MFPDRKNHLREKEAQSVPAVRVRCRTFQLPHVHDAAVIGSHAPFDRRVLGETLRLLTRETFASVDLRDEIVGAILVREAILKKIGWKMVRRIVLENVRPLMASTEIMALEFRIEITLTEGA